MRKKQRTYEQVVAAQAKAVQAAENLQDDPDLADELESLTPEEYAERKHLEIIEANPRRQHLQYNPRPNFFGFGSDSQLSKYRDTLKVLKHDTCNTAARARVAKLALDVRKSLAELKSDLRAAGLTTAQILDVADMYRSKRNLTRKEDQFMPTKDELLERISELEAENENLSERLDQILDIADDGESENEDWDDSDED